MKDFIQSAFIITIILAALAFVGVIKIPALASLARPAAQYQPGQQVWVLMSDGEREQWISATVIESAFKVRLEDGAEHTVSATILQVREAAPEPTRGGN